MVPLAASPRLGISRRASSKLKHSEEGRKGMVVAGGVWGRRAGFEGGM